MPIYAVLYDDSIGNIIVADSANDAELLTSRKCVELEDKPGRPGVGWKYNGVDFEEPKTETSATEQIDEVK